MSFGVIYYTNNKLDPLIMSTCQKQLRDSFKGEIICTSLKPTSFGKNIVVEGESGVKTMYKQILIAIENSTADYIFFCEHDVLYNKSHFDFTPLRDDTFYYNVGLYRWDYPNDRAITYNNLTSLSQLCVSRKLALEHYRFRIETIEKNNWENGRDPYWARKIGYEPGTKRRKRGALTDELRENWQSEFPNVDIRHKGTITKPKTSLSSFKHPPVNFIEVKLDDIPGWNLKRLFNL